MKRLAMIAAGGLISMLPSIASARPHFFFGIHFPIFAPVPIVVEPAPVVVAPAPAPVCEPAPVYQAPVYQEPVYQPAPDPCAPAPVVVAPAPVYVNQPEVVYAPAWRYWWGPRYYYHYRHWR
jgi:hypothetical protein